MSSLGVILNKNNIKINIVFIVFIYNVRMENMFLTYELLNVDLIQKIAV